MKTQTRHRGLFALLALASLASASFTVWSAALAMGQQWTALQPEIYAALLQFVLRGVMA